MNEIDWTPPIIHPIELRVYYDDMGKILFYTCEKPEGNYLVIDTQVYAEGRPDLRVVDGKLVKIAQRVVVTKLVHSTEGTPCAAEDISIVVDTDTPDRKFWQLKTYFEDR